MFYFIKFLESVVFPPGLFIFLLALLSVFTYPRLKLVAALIGLVTILLYAASASVIAYALIRPLEQAYSDPLSPSGDAIVMLGGGATFGTPNVSGNGNLTGDAANRLIVTAVLYHKLQLPIILSSGPMQGGTSQSLIAKQELMALGVPANRIWTENDSLNTQQNARNTKPILDKLGLYHPILVTSAYHMKRAVLDFQQVGIVVRPYPSGYFVDKPTKMSADLFYPSSAALSTTETALHEYVGIWATQLHLRG